MFRQRTASAAAKSLLKVRTGIERTVVMAVDIRVVMGLSCKSKLISRLAIR